MNRKPWQSYVMSATLAAGSLLLAAQSQAEGPTMVGDFGLIDHQGTQYQLTRLGSNKAVVILSQANRCEEIADALPRYKLLRTTFENQGVKFLMIDSSLDDNLQSIRARAQTYDIDFPIMLDDSQLVAENLGITKAGEVLVIDPNSREVLFHGPLDRAGFSGGDDDGGGARQGAAARGNGGNGGNNRRGGPPSTPLADLLKKVTAGDYKAEQTVNVEVTKGCPINFPAKLAQTKSVPDYAKDVAPILKENCAHCHVQGGIGPWAMTSYDIVRGFAPMMREVLLTKRMPPVQVDPHVSHFQNANYISNAQLQTLVHWIDAGAPRGNSKVDPLASVKPIESEWELGPPDVVVDVPAFDVPATGVIDYFNHLIELNFPEDRYVRAIQFIPGDKRVLHHLLSYIVSPQTDKSQVNAINEENVRDFLEGYAPGKTSATIFPKGTGVFIPKGYKLTLQMHYTPMGKATTDNTRIGLYFYKTPPEFKYLTYPISNGGAALNIPPGATDHKMNGSYVFKDDIVLYALRPHMHYRGKAFRFTAVLPDGSRETLLNEPAYNFAWQPTFRLTEPKKLPAGTRIITDGVYDNSKFNLGNPDPTAVAKGGPQSWDEMFIGYVTYTLPNNPNNKKGEKVTQ